MSEENKKSKGQWHGGKGSKQKDNDHNKNAENYDKIFNTGNKKKLSKRERVLMEPPLFKNEKDKK